MTRCAPIRWTRTTATSVLFAARPLLLLPLLLLLQLPLGCEKLESLTGGSDAVPQEPVAECQAYEQRMASCFHREVAFASQPSLIPKTREDLKRIQALCNSNLERLEVTCR